LGSSDAREAAPCIRLAQGREALLVRSRHPWIYRQNVAAVDAEADPRALLPVAAAGGQTVAWGFYSPDSLLAVRVVSWGEGEPVQDWLAQRLRTACALRARLQLDSDAARLVNAEGDFLPGLIADKYGDTVVVSPHIAAIEAVIGDVTRTLLGFSPGRGFS